MRLEIELVPRTAWYKSLRKQLIDTGKRTEWDRTRKEAAVASNWRCAICGAEGRLNCHELWDYDDEKHLQKLTGFVVLCDRCHHVKHFGNAQILAGEGKLDLEKVIQHFMKVNNCSRKDFDEHKTRAFEEWRNRSEHDWRTDLGDYTDMLAG